MTNKYSIVSYVKDEARFFLRAMLESVVPFTDEIVIVDNGSSDHTVPMIKEYPKIKLLEVETSQKDISIAINKAIAQVTNDWILIMAGDEVFLPQEMMKIHSMIDEMIRLDKRIGMIQYLDFVRDFRHYHTKYICWASRIWKNECGFHFAGDWMGEIYMGYNDGVHTGGIEIKKNLPEEQIYRRADVKFFHYARCKPKRILKRKRQLYWERRIPISIKKEHGLQLETMHKSSIRQDWIKYKVDRDPFYTLDFGDQIAVYEGLIPKYLEAVEMEEKEIKRMSYLEYLQTDYVNAVKLWRERYIELLNDEWVTANNLVMSYSGKKPWERDRDIYEQIILDRIKNDIHPGPPSKGGNRILDVGCGFGFLLYQFHQMGFRHLFGIDLAKICVTICRERFQDKEIPVYVSEENIEEGTFYEENSFDIITCTEVLEHCKNPAAVIREIVRLLKPGGTAYFSMPYLDRRQAWTHINLLYTNKDNLVNLKLPENLGEYNLVNVDYLFRGLNYTVSMSEGKKFLIVELGK